jgi:hypothetical protein
MPVLLNSANHYQASTAKYLHTTARVWLLFELVQYENFFHTQNQYNRCTVIERVGLQAETFASLLMSYIVRHFVITTSHLKLNTLILITDRLHWTVFFLLHFSL